MGKIRLVENLTPANVAELRDTTNFSTPIETLGNASAGDGGARRYYFDATSLLADNGVTVIKPDSVASGEGGRWREAPWSGGGGGGGGSASTTYVDTVAALRTITDFTKPTQTYGVTSKGDGGARLYYWDSASTATDNGTSIIKPSSVGSGSAGRWREAFRNRAFFSPETTDVNTSDPPANGEVPSWNESTGEYDHVPLPSGGGGGSVSGMAAVATIANLKAASTSGLSADDSRRVLGYASAGDGGGGDFRWVPSSTALDDGGVVLIPNSNPSSGRWIRVIETPVNVRWFGAVGGNVTADTLGFQRALAYSAASSNKKSIEVPYAGQDYLINAELTMDGQRLFSHDPRTCVRWPTDLGANKHALTMLGSSNWERRSEIENLVIQGSTGPYTLGSAPYTMHGIRVGGSGDNDSDGVFLKPVLKGLKVIGWNSGLVFDSATGHTALYDCSLQHCYYGLYMRRGNGDYRFFNVNIQECMFACIGLAKNTGLVQLAWTGGHCGYSPYAIYQSNVNDTLSSGDRMGGMLQSCSFDVVSFESCGNGMILSEAAWETPAEPGTMTSNYFRACFMTYNDDYRIFARNRNWTISINWAENNVIEMPKDKWGVGDEGLIDVSRSDGGYSGANAWKIYGRLPDIGGGQVFMNGNTAYSKIESFDYQEKQVTITAGTTSATYTLDAWEEAMADNIRPVVTPLSDPGSRFWVTKSGNVITVRLSSAPSGNVTFNLHLMP